MLWHRYIHWDVIGERAGDFIEWSPEARGTETFLKTERAVTGKVERQVMTFDEFFKRENSEPSLVRRFLDVVRSDQPSPSSLDRSIAEMRVCEALHESARTGQVVTL
jgi:predicted dehydrogenase